MSWRDLAVYNKPGIKLADARRPRIMIYGRLPVGTWNSRYLNFQTVLSAGVALTSIFASDVRNDSLGFMLRLAAVPTGCIPIQVDE